MKTIILVDQHGFNSQDTQALLKLGFGNENLLGRVPFQLALQQGNQTVVPTLIFPDQVKENQFFNLIKERKTVLAFTTLPYDKLTTFYGKRFRDNLRNISIEISLPENNWAYSMHANRMIEFRFVEQLAVQYTIDTSVVYQTTESTYQVYLNPLVLSLADNTIFTCYRNFFENRKDFPIALPPISNDNAYFASTEATGANKRISLAELRSRLREFFNSTSNKTLSGKLFYHLWQLPDIPVFREYLKDGAYFQLASKEESRPFDIRSFEEDGRPDLCFNYFCDERDFLSKWRGSLLQTGLNDEMAISDLKKAYVEDVTKALSGISMNVKVYVGAKEPDLFNWISMGLRDFNHEYPRSKEGYWTEIQDCIYKMNDPELVAFVQGKILEPGQAQGPINSDHNLTREIFADYLCAYPFNEKKELQYAWLDCLIDVIRNDGLLRATDVTAVSEPENGIYLYDRMLSREAMMKLRLALPTDAEIRCRATNILDHSNAFLDEKFILE